MQRLGAPVPCPRLHLIRFHLRARIQRQYPSLLIANGEHRKRIQALMGHSSTNVTMGVYGHLMPGGEGEIADRLGTLVVRFERVDVHMSGILSRA
jgi:integrase